MGIESPLQSVPAEGIGGLAIGVTPLEMADAYATLANGGIHHDPTAISKVEFPDGKVDDFEKDAGERVLTPGQAYEVTRILEGVITQGTGAGYTSMGCTSAAGKTGTSEELSDAWFVGYTPLFSTAVWVGHPTSREYTGFGGPTAGPIWANYMSEAVEGDCPEFEAPAQPARTRRPRQRTHLFERLQRLRRRRNLRRRRRRIRRRRQGQGKGRRRRRRRKHPRPRTDPEPTPDPGAEPDSRTPGRRRHQPRLIADSELWGPIAPQISESLRLLPDQLDPVAVGVADEADAVALGAAAGAVGRLFGLDADARRGARGWRRGPRRRGRCGCSRCRGRSESTPWL